MKVLCANAIEAQRAKETVPIEPPTVTEFNEILEMHRDLFRAQDAVYAHLRLIDSTPAEMNETRRRIKIMKRCWNKMNLSITPKAHLVFEHAADDQMTFGGIGDKVEDHLETRHQEQGRYDHILLKMQGSFKARMNRQLKYEWRNLDVRVQKQVELVNSRKQPRINPATRVHLPTIGDLNRQQIKAEQKQMRQRYIIKLDAE